MFTSEKTEAVSHLLKSYSISLREVNAALKCYFIDTHSINYTIILIQIVGQIL